MKNEHDMETLSERQGRLAAHDHGQHRTGAFGQAHGNPGLTHNAGHNAGAPHGYSQDKSGQRPPLWGLPDPETQGEFYADIPVKRAIAWVFDSLLISAITGLVVLMTAGIGLFFIGFLYMVIGFVYRVATLSGGSATLGMRLTSIEFRTHQGERFSGATAFLHTLGFSASMSFVLPQVISIVLILTSARAQGLTDMVLGTAAINRAGRQ